MDVSISRSEQGYASAPLFEARVAPIHAESVVVEQNGRIHTLSL